MIATKQPLTPKQAAILKFVVTYWGTHATAPTIREIGREFKFKSINGATSHLKALAAKGWIELPGADGVTARGIVVPELRDAARAAADDYLEGRL